MKKKKIQTTLKDKTIIKDKKAYVYFLRCSDDSLYCGYTTNLEKRLKNHNNGLGAKYTASRLPVSLVYYEEYSSIPEAMSREWHIHHDKKFTKQRKEEIVDAFNKDINNQVFLNNINNQILYSDKGESQCKDDFLEI